MDCDQNCKWDSVYSIIWKGVHAWFDVGHFWDAPTKNIAPLSQASISGCMQHTRGCCWLPWDIWLWTVLPSNPRRTQVHCSISSLLIAFSNIGTGSIKTRADFSNDMKEVWRRMGKQCTYNTERVLAYRAPSFNWCLLQEIKLEWPWHRYDNITNSLYM